MTDLRRRFMDDMTLHGMAPTTQKVYVHAVKQLAAHYGRSPDQLSEQELRDYFLYLANEKQVASSTLRLQIFAVKFLYTRTLQKPWPTLKILRARPQQYISVAHMRATGLRCTASSRLASFGSSTTGSFCCGLPRRIFSVGQGLCSVLV